MKRLRGTQSWAYDTLMLFREDLEELMAIFNPTDAPDSITISDTQTEYESLDEMQKHRGEHVTELVIRSKTPRVTLHLIARPKALNLYTVEATDEADATFYRANSFLQPKRRTLHRFATQYIPALLVVLAVVFLYIDIRHFPWLIKLLPSWAWVVVIALFYLVSKAVDHVDKNRATLICLKRKHEAPNFFKRNEDRIVIAVASAVLSVIGTLIVQRILKP